MFVALVPHTCIEDDSGDESAIHYADEETDDKESGKILGDAREDTNKAPGECESGQPESWGCELEANVTGYLEQDVANEVDGQCGEKLVPVL